jgi:dihydroflavonol-4-reductase
MSADRVLVTGASGFIAKHCMSELLKSGYRVRGTVRNLERRGEIEQALVAADVEAPEFELAEADLNHDAGWAKAVDGCRYVLHLASPFPSHEPRDPDELIKPARDGALRVLRAAATAGVERVVQTSSIAAIMHCGKPDAVARTEADWTDIGNSQVSSYARSKTIAERAAWDAMDELSATSAIEFCTINPGVVFGPALDKDLSTSHVLLRLLGHGAYAAVPKVAYPSVDVRDVARQHVIAMTHPGAAGQRWLSTDGTLSIREIGQIIVKVLPDLKRKVPSMIIPSPIVRLAATYDRNLRSIKADLGKSNLCDNSKTVTGLGMTFRTGEEAVTAAAQSLRTLGII